MVRSGQASQGEGPGRKVRANKKKEAAMKKLIILGCFVSLMIYAGFGLFNSMRSTIELRHGQIEQICEVR